MPDSCPAGRCVVSCTAATAVLRTRRLAEPRSGGLSLLLAGLAEPCLEGNVCTHGFGSGDAPPACAGREKRTEEVNLSQGPRILGPLPKPWQTCLTRAPNFPETRVCVDGSLSSK